MCFKHINRANDYNCCGNRKYRRMFIDVIAIVFVLLQGCWKLYVYIHNGDDKQLYVFFFTESFIHILRSNNKCTDAKFSLRIFKGTFSLMASQTGFVENDLSNATDNTVKAIYFSDIRKKRDMQITFWFSPVSLLVQKN